MAVILKMASNKIGKISIFSDFKENWYLGLFWSEELIGNDEITFRVIFIFKMAADKIDKFQCSLISMKIDI